MTAYEFILFSTSSLQGTKVAGNIGDTSLETVCPNTYPS